MSRAWSTHNHTHTHTHNNASHIVLLSLDAHGHNFTLHPIFFSSEINDGRFKLCTAWQTSGTPIVSLAPFSPEDLQMGSPGQGWIHLHPRSFGKGSPGKLERPLQILGLTKYILCVSVCVYVCVWHCQTQFSFLSQQTPSNFKGVF